MSILSQFYFLHLFTMCSAHADMIAVKVGQHDGFAHTYTHCTESQLSTTSLNNHRYAHPQVLSPSHFLRLVGRGFFAQNLMYAFASGMACQALPSTPFFSLRRRHSLHGGHRGAKILLRWMGLFLPEGRERMTVMTASRRVLVFAWMQPPRCRLQSFWLCQSCRLDHFAQTVPCWTYIYIIMYLYIYIDKDIYIYVISAPQY